MVYLTHPVRRIRDEPAAGESVTLLVTAGADASVAALETTLAAHGTVEERLRFGTVRVTVPQSAVAAVCELPGLDRVETANALALGGAGEDVGFDG